MDWLGIWGPKVGDDSTRDNGLNWQIIYFQGIREIEKCMTVNIQQFLIGIRRRSPGCGVDKVPVR